VVPSWSSWRRPNVCVRGCVRGCDPRDTGRGVFRLPGADPDSELDSEGPAGDGFVSVRHGRFGARVGLAANSSVHRDRGCHSGRDRGVVTATATATVTVTVTLPMAVAGRDVHQAVRDSKAAPRHRARGQLASTGGSYELPAQQCAGPPPPRGRHDQAGPRPVPTHSPTDSPTGSPSRLARRPNRRAASGPGPSARALWRPSQSRPVGGHWRSARANYTIQTVQIESYTIHANEPCRP
jgi:hypothetical protein